MKLKERERRVQELEGRLDTIIIIVSFIIVIFIIIVIIIVIITMVRLKDDQLMGRIREAEHSQQVAIVMILMILMLILRMTLMISKVTMAMTMKI